MTIEFKNGNIFNSNAQTITNTINLAGAMGKGLALEFRKKYPDLYKDYKIRVAEGSLRPGIPYVYEGKKRRVLNFPTKRHWRGKARIEDIEAGLKFIEENYHKMGITSLALPPLGCGEGGLEWPAVREIIEKHLGKTDLLVYVYEDQEPAPEQLSIYPKENEETE